MTLDPVRRASREKTTSEIFDPTQLDDATATRMGLYYYRHGNVYNNSTTLEVTCTPNQGGTFTVNGNSYFIPYQMQDSSWRLKSFITVSFDTNQTSVNLLAVSGISITPESGGVNRQPGLVYIQNSTSGQNGIPERNFWVAASNAFQAYRSGDAAYKQVNVWSDISLDAKPTWAY